MNLLQDIITYVRRIVKTPSNTSLSDDLIIDYINRFWIMDVDARIQLFDLKKKYQFQTVPGQDNYNMPLYSVQTEPGSQTIAQFPVYQGFLEPCSVNGRPISFATQRNSFWGQYNLLQSLSPTTTGDGTVGPYSISLPSFPALMGHIDLMGIMAIGASPVVDPPVTSSFLTTVPTTSVFPAVYITSVDADGNSVVISDSGQFLENNVGYGLLMNPGAAPFGNASLGTYNTSTNTVNYAAGTLNITFPVAIPSGTNINTQCYFFQQGMPVAALFFNNCLTLRPPPDIQYLVEIDAYLSPAAFLVSAAAIPFGYMTEYIARGAARKILSDTGDVEQFNFYEPLFREQEILVWKRSQRQFTSTRTQTIYSHDNGQGNYNHWLGGYW